MNTELDASKWRIKIVHDCDNHGLRGAAIRRMLELKQKASSQVTVEHNFLEKAGVDVVDVGWMNQKITVVVAFHQGQALVGLKVPLVLQLFKNVVEKRVEREIRQVIADAGGNVSEIVQVA